VNAVLHRIPCTASVAITAQPGTGCPNTIRMLCSERVIRPDVCHHGLDRSASEYVHVHTCEHVQTCVHVQTYLHVHTCLHVHACVPCEYMCTCAYTCTMCIHVYMRINVFLAAMNSSSTRDLRVTVQVGLVLIVHACA
jgi:hypothetical protein